MPSKRERVIDAVTALVAATFPDAVVKRNAAKSAEIGAKGYIIVEDGDPGEPEVILSPVSYLYEHRIPVSVAVNPGTVEDAESTLDDMLVILGQAIAANRTLGGLCDWIEAEAPVTGAIEDIGAVAARQGETAILAIYATTNPLT